MCKIKFCGITNYDDARLALDLGVDALGFNFYGGSSRCVSIGDAQAIVRKLPASVWLVGVFVNSTRAQVEHIARFVGLDTLQFHGDEAVEFSQGWSKWRVLRALRVELATPSEVLVNHLHHAEYLMLDSFTASQYGGTGNEIDDQILQQITPEIFTKSFLCGGLTPENVAAKIKRYQPYGVDVAGGIEVAAGKKAAEKMRKFVQAVRDAI